MTTPLEGWQPDGTGVLTRPAGESLADIAGQFAYGARFTWPAGAPDATLTAWAYVSPGEQPGTFEVWWKTEYTIRVCTACGRRLHWSARVNGWLVDQGQAGEGACWPHTPWSRFFYEPDDGEWHGSAETCERAAREAAEILATTRRTGESAGDFMFFAWDGSRQ